MASKPDENVEPKPRKRGRGRPFAVGNPGGPGRPSLAAEAGFLAAAKRGAPDAEWEAAVAACLARAKKNGDAHALLALAKVLPGATAPARVEAEVSTPDGAGLVIRYENDWKPNLDAPTETPRAADGDAPPPA